MDEHIYDYGEKVLVSTFASSDKKGEAGFTGKYYKDGRMEIFYRVKFGDEWMDTELVDTMHNIEEYRAEYMFEHHYGDKAAENPNDL